MFESIIIPTTLEAGIVLDSMPERKEFSIQGKPFFSINLNNTSFTLCICGIGKANAAHGAAILFERFRPSSVLVLGVAGAYPDAGLDIGDIAVGLGEVYGDEGLLSDDGIRTMDSLGLPLASISQKDYYNEFPLFVPDKLKTHRHKGRFLTVSGCSGTKKQGMALSKQFDAVAENMEGAAIAHIGALNNVPVTEIRGISNIVEDRNGGPLDKRALRLAAENAQHFFIEKILLKN